MGRVHIGVNPRGKKLSHGNAFGMFGITQPPKPKGEHHGSDHSGEFSFQVQDARRSCGVLQRSIPVPFSTRGPSSAGCLSGTLPSSISHADRQSKSWFASGNSPLKRPFVFSFDPFSPGAVGIGKIERNTQFTFNFLIPGKLFFHDLPVSDLIVPGGSILINFFKVL